MKIEVGESLIYSYLKHVKNCKIVQLNWTKSSQWEKSTSGEQKARALYESILQKKNFSKIFKNKSNSNFDKLLKQLEIDVLGIDIKNQAIYAIDVAVHLLRLDYGNKAETANRVCRKILKSIFIMQIYFEDYDNFNSFFVTPNIGPGLEKKIKNKLRKIKKIVEQKNITIDFITNERFFKEIYKPTIENTKEEHNSNELFARFYKLNKLNENKLKPRKVYKKRKSISTKKKPINPENLNFLKWEMEIKGVKFIGYEEGKKYPLQDCVRETFHKLFKNNLLSSEEINNLQTVTYWKKYFKGLDFALLRQKEDGRKDGNGYNRYWAEVFDNSFYVCSQWWRKNHEDNFKGLKKYLDYLKPEIESKERQI